MKLLLGTFAFSLASALNPLLPVEVYLAGVAAQAENRNLWLLALAAGVGATIGKLIWFYAGVHSMKIPWLRKKMEKPKWQASYVTWNQRIHGRPMLAGGIVFTSAFTGFPPLAVIAVLAGTLRMNVGVFLVTVTAGRTLRFWTVLAGVDSLRSLFPGTFA